MTKNQIEYLKYLEEKRSNLAQERLASSRDSEARRHNLSTEQITVRYNDVSAAETERANRAKERENFRSNKAREDENTRHNLATEAQTRLDSERNLRLKSRELDLREYEWLEDKRSNVAKEMETHRANVAKETETNRSNKVYEKEIHRSNVVNEDIKQSTLDEQRRSNLENEAIRYQANDIAISQMEASERNVIRQTSASRYGSELSASASRYGTDVNAQNVLLQIREQKRHNKAVEKETNRSNLAGENIESYKATTGRVNTVLDYYVGQQRADTEKYRVNAHAGYEAGQLILGSINTGANVARQFNLNPFD